jgi:hypothetical protein
MDLVPGEGVLEFSENHSIHADISPRISGRTEKTGGFLHGVTMNLGIMSMYQYRSI